MFALSKSAAQRVATRTTTAEYKNRLPRKPFSALCICLTTLLVFGCKGTTDPGSSSSSSGSPGVTRPNIGIENVVINEAAATNVEYTDLEGDTPDWIELYNASDSLVSLAGWSITDDIDTPSKWVFPQVSLAAGEYLRIWASDKGESGTFYTPAQNDEVAMEQQTLHTNFKISADGETLYLFDTTNTQIHSLEVNQLKRQTSVGLSVNSGQRVLFMEPTPGTRNPDQEFIGVVDSEVTFSHFGGINSPESVVLSSSGTDETIRYSLDGSVPDFDSPVYIDPIPIDETQVIRASAFREYHIPGDVGSKTFLFGQQHDIAVVTLETDPKNFFDEDYGIYVFGDDFEQAQPFYGANFWEDWERDVHFSFYEPDGSLGVELDAGVKIFGGWSRAREQRSLSIFARDKYGVKKIEYPLFPNREYNEFKSVVLRNSGNDWMLSMLRDATATSLMAGTTLDYQDFRPVAVYLNGEYWGMYNLREKVNEDYLESRHGFDKDEFTILQNNGDIVEGSNEEYLQLTEFIENSSLDNQDNYQNVADAIDIENFTIYQIAQIYFDNQDWPGNNIKYWKTPETSWRWILYDTDYGFSIYENRFQAGYLNDTLSFALAENGPDWPNPPWSTLILRRLLENEGFKTNFINRFADELNSRFKGEPIVAHIDSIAEPIATEIPKHFKRWYTPGRDQIQDPQPADFMMYWESELDRMKTFALMRAPEVRQHIMDQFDLSGIYTVNIHNPSSTMGHVKINSLEIEGTTWSGEYFGDVPVTVSALPIDGYVFSHWEDSEANEVQGATLELNLTGDIDLSAFFIALPNN